MCIVYTLFRETYSTIFHEVQHVALEYYNSSFIF